MALLPAVAQIQDPVQFKTELKTISDTEAQIVFTGKIDAGWHVYSTDLPSGGVPFAHWGFFSDACIA